MNDKQQYTRIHLVNRLPINQVAMSFLPKDWQGTEELAVLTLMRWGMANGVVMNPVAADHPDNDQLMIQINLIER